MKSDRSYGTDHYHYSSEHASPADGLWRLHMQAVYRHFIAQWIGSADFHRILKTDLFDEATIPFHPTHDLICPDSFFVGLDISRQIATRARFNLPSQCCITMGDVRKLPFQDGSFDLIFSNSTLDHFSRPDDIGRSVAEMARVLSPGGRLFITMDNPRNPVIAFRNRLPFRLLHFLKIVPYYMGATLSRKALIRTLEEKGFNVLHATFADFTPRVLLVWLWRLGQRDPRSLKIKRMLQFLWHLERWCSNNRLVSLGCFIMVWAEKKEKAE